VSRLLDYFGPYVRKVGMVLAGVGLLVAFYTEAFSDVKTGRGGRPKPPLVEQRTTYILLIAGGLPGLAWALVRVARGRQRTIWE
jgi:hypothetical protein